MRLPIKIDWEFFWRLIISGHVLVLPWLSPCTLAVIGSGMAVTLCWFYFGTQLMTKLEDARFERFWPNVYARYIPAMLITVFVMLVSNVICATPIEDIGNSVNVFRCIGQGFTMWQPIALAFYLLFWYTPIWVYVIIFLLCIRRNSREQTEWALAV